MAGSASDYHRGDQDISEQVSTFHVVMGMTKWGCLAMAAMLALLVLWFCTPAGFFTGLIAAVVVLVIGITVLRDRGGAAH
jgi:hypothetical protein